jgi:hypothetical protein
MRNVTWLWIIVGLSLAAGLPLAGKLLRGQRGPFCTLDGAEINSPFRVRIVDSEGCSHLFCCLRCAELWQSRQAAGVRAIYVTDEKTRSEVPVESAFFVKSRVAVPTAPVNRVHVFAKRQDAERHAAVHGGRLLDSMEKPFHQ